jgi:cytochrome c2
MPPFHPSEEGFESLVVDLTPRSLPKRVDGPVTAEEGRRVTELMGCVACHSQDGSTLGKIGPSWKGLFGRRRVFADGSEVVADEAYVRQSIREPSARVVKGFEKSDAGMPSYEGVITDGQIKAVVLYLKTLK